MPQNTPNLNMECFDLTTDAGVYFSSWRISLAGYTNSALTKIDTWAGQVNSDLNTLKQSPTIIRVVATKNTDLLYNASVVGFTEYRVGQYINISLDNENIGASVSLNINNLGNKSLLKINGSGNAINVTPKDLKKNKNYLFTYNGASWVWVNAVSSDQLSISGVVGNLIKISSNNTIEDSGVALDQLLYVVITNAEIDSVELEFEDWNYGFINVIPTSTEVFGLITESTTSTEDLGFLI
jgi:hypothetical protein